MKKEFILTQQFTSPLFRFDDLRRYTLYLEINEHYYCCWAKENKHSEIHWLEVFTRTEDENNLTFLENIQKIYTSHRLISSIKWKEVAIYFNNQHFTQLPLALFQKEYSIQYLQLAKGNLLDKEQEVYVDELEANPILTIFAENSSLYNWLTEQYPFLTIKIQHLSSILCDAVIADTEDSIKALLHIHADHCFLVIAHASQLLFCNRLLYQTSEELTFLVLHAINELAINPENIQFSVTGLVKEDSPSYQILCDYLPHIHIKTSEETQNSTFFCHQFIPHHS